jgi:hypothetical protein
VKRPYADGGEQRTEWLYHGAGSIAYRREFPNE